MKPLMSFRTRAGSLRSDRAKCITASAVASSVCSPLMISRNRVTWQGSAQCMPMKRLGWVKCFCRDVIGKADVFVARGTLGPITASSSLKSAILTSKSSKMLSMTKSQSENSASDSASE